MDTKQRNSDNIIARDRKIILRTNIEFESRVVHHSHPNWK